MSDEYYRQRAARRGRIMWVIAGGLVVIICVVAGGIRTYQDSCTGSFERSPRAVIESYAQAISQGDSSRVKNCWQHDPFYETNTGCSDICLSKIFGNQFEISKIEFGDEIRTDDGRLTMDVSVSVACSTSDDHHEAEITLDTAVQNYPWRHWHIIYSSLGGTVGESWCK